MLDKLQVERERGITVKAQTASLFYNHEGETYLLNLIDTPVSVSQLMTKILVIRFAFREMYRPMVSVQCEQKFLTVCLKIADFSSIWKLE